jgi:hypothetical protein
MGYVKYIFYKRVKILYIILYFGVELQKQFNIKLI